MPTVPGVEKTPPGERFGRKKMVAMGVSLGSDPVTVRLSEDQTTVAWSSVETPTFGSVKVRAPFVSYPYFLENLTFRKTYRYAAFVV